MGVVGTDEATNHGHRQLRSLSCRTCYCRAARSTGVSSPAPDARTKITLAPAQRNQVRTEMQVLFKGVQGVVARLGDLTASRPGRQRA